MEFDIGKPSTWLSLVALESSKGVFPVSAQVNRTVLESYERLATLRSSLLETFDKNKITPTEISCTVDRITDFCILRSKLCSTAAVVHPPPRLYQWQGITGLFVHVPRVNIVSQIRESCQVISRLLEELCAVHKSIDESADRPVRAWRLMSVAELIIQCIQIASAYYRHLLFRRPEQYAGLTPIPLVDPVAAHSHVARISAC